MDRLTAWDKGYAYFPKCFEEPCGGNGCTKENCDFMESLCTKLAQYEDIGTLEEFKFLKENRFTHTELAEIACGLNRLAKYEDIGTLEEVRDAVEKQKAKKVVIEHWSPSICPRCGNELSESLGDVYYSHPTFLERCPNPDCAQRLDWGEEE